MSTVITVENLGKKYTLHHQQREQYTALRDVITSNVASLANRLFHTFHRSLNPQPSTLIPTFEDFWALKDVSFEVKQGDRIGIIGRNGAGKSTLLKILSRITEITSGKITIRGRIASLLEVGTGFHPELSGRENIYLNGAILGMNRREIKSKFDEIVAFAEIERFLDTPVKRYSSGMYVRLAFAVAAHLEPEILIVDEVLAVGDFAFRRKCLGKMQEVGNEGRTILFVSHDVSQITSLCTRALLLYEGRIVNNGIPSEIVADYIHSFSGLVLHKNPHIRSTLIQEGDGGIYIEEAALLNISGCISNSFTAQETILLRLRLKSSVTNQNFAAVWFLHNEEGTQIAVGASYPMDSILFSSDIPEILCKIEPESLVPGIYRLRVVLHIPHQKTFDSWDDAVCFEITTHDMVGAGYSYPGIWSARQYVRHCWLPPN